MRNLVVAMRVIRLCHYFKSGRRRAGRWVSRGARLVAGGTATGHACVCLVVVRLWFAGIYRVCCLGFLFRGSE